MRFLALSLGVALVGVLVTPAAEASACADPIVDENGVISGCASDGSVGEDAFDGGRDVVWRPPDGWDLVEYRVQAYEDDGTPCIRVLHEWMPSEDVAGFLTFANTSWFLWYDRLTADGTTMENCVADPGDPGLDPAMVRQMITSQLPLPAPSIEPGRAITGLRSYLDVGAPTSFRDSIIGDVLPVRVDIDAVAQYRVDWGDGTVETFDSSGGDYPDGDVTHVYTEVGHHTVTVTPVWTVSWIGGGIDATFAADLVPSTVELPVGEVQAVRTR